MFDFTKSILKRAYIRSKGYSRNNDGTAAIEFGLLAIPFFALIFGILELAIVLFLSSTMTHAVSEAGRQIRVGNFQACGGNAADAFKGLICDNMSGIGDCQGRLRVDVETGNNFASITLPAPPEHDQDIATIPNGSVDNTSGGDPVVARAIYYYKLALPAELTRLETTQGSGVRMLYASTAFRNEPFSSPGTCPP